MSGQKKEEKDDEEWGMEEKKGGEQITKEQITKELITILRILDFILPALGDQKGWQQMNEWDP